MAHEPKRRHSTERKGKRRASLKLTLSKSVKCTNCDTDILSHLVCKKCGFYNGKQVIKIKTKKINKKTA